MDVVDPRSGPAPVGSRGSPTGFGATAGVGTWIERRARIAPDRPALIAGGRTITHRELAERIRRLANGLQGLGVSRGDRVAWIGDNHVAFLESLFACGRIGAALAPVNHRLSPGDRAAILEDTEPVVLIEHRVATATPAPGSVRHRLQVGVPTAGATSFESLVASSPDTLPGAIVRLDDPLLLPHTSGTTGSPKAVVLTHANVTWNVVNFLATADFRSDDVTVAIAPFFRTGGIGVNVLPVLFKGGTVVVLDAPEPAAILDAIEQSGVTVGFGNPDLLEALVRSPRWNAADLSAVRFILTGGAPVPDRLLRTYRDRGVTLLQGYGLTEAAPLVLLLDPASAERKSGSAGQPPPFVDIRIVGDDGRDLDWGVTGELLVRGPNVMAGYWRRPGETADALRDGWLRTGDAARMDDEGFVWIVDRVSARFLTPGGAVYPGDVERVLQEHPAVADAGVVPGGPDDDLAGIVAFIVPEQDRTVTETELLAFARPRLAAHAVPTRIRFLARLPRTTVGKLQREALRELARVAGSSADDPAAER